MKAWLLPMAVIGLLYGQYTSAQASGPLESLADGPYVFYEDGQPVARWIKGGEPAEVFLEEGRPFSLPAAVCPSFDAQYFDPGASFAPAQQISFEGVERVLALSDIHGQYGLFLQLLKAHKAIDENNNWAFGNGHLVILGDIFDRGDGVTELLWLVHKLEQQAEKANGKVHYLLGNHEVMAINGDLRYIHKKYRYTMAALQKNYDELFGPDTYLGRWLRSKPVAISINRTAYVHAGISEALLQSGMSFEDMNTAFQERILMESEEAILADPLLSLLYMEEGPVWYRGYFEEGFDKRQARSILRQLRKKHIVVGHTSFQEIMYLYKGKVIGIDSSIKLGKRGEALLVEEGKFYKGTLEGKKIRLK